MFSKSEKLVKISEGVLDGCMGIKKGESVLIITNPSEEVFAVSQSLYDAVNNLSGNPTLVVQNTRGSDKEGEGAVYKALLAVPDVAISISELKLGQDPYGAKQEYSFGGQVGKNLFSFLRDTKQNRSFWSPGITVDHWQRFVDVDYKAMQEEVAVVNAIFAHATEAHVTSDRGCDFTVGLGRWAPRKDDGNWKNKGEGGNIPCGEVYVSPIIGTTSGHMVFDGTLSYYSKPSGIQPKGEAIEMDVVKGFVNLESIVGGSCAPVFKSEIEKAIADAKSKGKSHIFIRNSLNIGELAVGLNLKATMTGSLLVDEKVYRTAHVAIGMNYDHNGKDEDGDAMNHLDCLITNPTIVFKMKESTMFGKEYMLMENGRLIL